MIVHITRGGSLNLRKSLDILIDLHTHTTCSDGTCEPGELVRQASAAGIVALGISDHDTLCGYDEACTEAATTSVELICSIELSTRLERQAHMGKRNQPVHLLGYFILSPPSPEFRQWLEEQQARRQRRNHEIVTKLQGLGLQITLAEVARCGRNQIGRRHFAKVLVEKEYVRNQQEAFDIYLADDAKAAVAREDPSIEEAIQRIRDGGGFASLAHPVRLPERSGDLQQLVTRLADAGLEGIEVVHSGHTPRDCAIYMGLAGRFDLIPTGGSDFHGDNKPSVRLGTGIEGNVRLSYEFLLRIKEMCCARS
jgi:predicted metal-dependent phosphoesterase TrpH